MEWAGEWVELQGRAGEEPKLDNKNYAVNIDIVVLKKHLKMN